MLAKQMVGVVVTVACIGLTAAQATPSITANGVNVTVVTGAGGSLNVNGMAAATVMDVANAADSIGGDVETMSNAVSGLTASLTAGISSVQSFQVATQQCVETGQLYDLTQGRCVAARPDANVYATADRMTVAEQNIDAIEAQLNGSNGGSHAFCAICPAQQYVSSPCNAEHGTQCAPCSTGTYSRGGYGQSCIQCAASVTNCGFATCTTATNAQCQWCSGVVQLGAAYVLSAPNTCTRCGQYTYRSTNTTCSACPKDLTCAQATCQANSGVTQLSGQASMSSIYGPALNGVTQNQFLARWNDGVQGYSPIGPHSGTNLANGDLTNPWIQIDLGANTRLVGIDRMVVYNRPGTLACRLFAQNNGNCRTVIDERTRTWDGPSEGAILGISDTPLTTSTTSFTPNPCRTPGQRNCRCAYLTRYNATNNGLGPYNVNCNGAVGRYAFLVLPGDIRMLNFGEMEIWGTYQTTSPAYSFCATPCQAANCAAGNSRCSGDQSTAVCTANGCTTSITNGVAYGYNSATQQCVQCNANNQYRTASGICQACPASCNGQACQVLNSAVTGGIPSHGPGQWRQQVPTLALDGDMRSYSETGTGANPWWQVNLGTSVRVATVSIRNRQDNCGARLFRGDPACAFGIVAAGSGNDRDFDGPTEGTTIRVGNTPCTGTNICPGVICGRITRPSTSGWDYTVTCSTPLTGSYISVQLPGTRRILQLANVAITQDTSQPTC
mmetsp:Transcript_16366/g.42491  ORF Transcript_16366/g.42491 Transcript_16366/m.42491 type:complete len:726 (-) Transcript_16366:181-2358(-)